MDQRIATRIEENPKMQSLMHPGEELAVDLKESEIDVAVNQFRKLLLTRMYCD
jgi:hypothetical protein